MSKVNNARSSDFTKSFLEEGFSSKKTDVSKISFSKISIIIKDIFEKISSFFQMLKQYLYPNKTDIELDEFLLNEPEKKESNNLLNAEDLKEKAFEISKNGAGGKTEKNNEKENLNTNILRGKFNNLNWKKIGLYVVGGAAILAASYLGYYYLTTPSVTANTTPVREILSNSSGVPVAFGNTTNLVVEEKIGWGLADKVVKAGASAMAGLADKVVEAGGSVGGTMAGLGGKVVEAGGSVGSGIVGFTSNAIGFAWDVLSNFRGIVNSAGEYFVSNSSNISVAVGNATSSVMGEEIGLGLTGNVVELAESVGSAVAGFTSQAIGLAWDTLGLAWNTLSSSREIINSAGECFASNSSNVSTAFNEVTSFVMPGENSSVEVICDGIRGTCSRVGELASGIIGKMPEEGVRNVVGGEGTCSLLPKLANTTVSVFSNLRGKINSAGEIQNCISAVNSSLASATESVGSSSASSGGFWKFLNIVREAINSAGGI